MLSFDERVLEVAGRQHFVVARDQLLEIGSRRQIDVRLKRGTLERLHRSVYRIAGSPQSWHQAVMAACFAGGKRSVASFRTAARLYDLPGGAEVVEITSPRDHRARHDGIAPHESFFLSELDVAYTDNIPTTRPARVINDLGLLVECQMLERDVLDHAMLEAVRRNLVDLRRVWREWERLGGEHRPGGRAVESLLHRFVPPLHTPDSRPETRLLQLIRAAGLPEPTPQFRVWLSRTRWVDLDYSWPDGKVYLEFDPYKWHGDRDKYMRDSTRRLELRRLGWDGVSVTDDELEAGAPLAIEVLRDLMQSRCVA